MSREMERWRKFTPTLVVAAAVAVLAVGVFGVPLGSLLLVGLFLLCPLMMMGMMMGMHGHGGRDDQGAHHAAPDRGASQRESESHAGELG